MQPKKLAKTYKVIILEWDTSREVEYKLQSEIDKYANTDWFEFRHETNLAPMITYEKGIQYNTVKYVITLIIKFND